MGTRKQQGESTHGMRWTFWIIKDSIRDCPAGVEEK